MREKNKKKTKRSKERGKEERKCVKRGRKTESAENEQWK